MSFDNLVDCVVWLSSFIRVDMMLDTGYWILDSGFWRLDSGYLILDSGFWILDSGYSMLAGRM